MSLNFLLFNVLLTVLILQVTKYCFAAEQQQHPFANPQFTTKEEYFNNYPTGEPKSFSYNVPFRSSNGRFYDYPAPYQARFGGQPRFFGQDPNFRDPNFINDDEDFDDRHKQKNAFNQPNSGHYVNKREIKIRPKSVQKPVPFPSPQRLKAYKRHKPTSPVPPPAETFQTPCNFCNAGYHPY